MNWAKYLSFLLEIDATTFEEIYQVFLKKAVNPEIADSAEYNNYINSGKRMRSASFLERMETEFLKRLQENPSLQVEYAIMIGQHSDEFYKFEKLGSKIAKNYASHPMSKYNADLYEITDEAKKTNFDKFSNLYGRFMFKNCQGQKRQKEEEDKGKFCVDLKHIKVETEFFANKIKVEQNDDNWDNTKLTPSFRLTDNLKLDSVFFLKENISF